MFFREVAKFQVYGNWVFVVDDSGKLFFSNVYRFEIYLGILCKKTYFKDKKKDKKGRFHGRLEIGNWGLEAGAILKQKSQTDSNYNVILSI